MNNLDKQYTTLLQDILDNGVTKQDRTGTGTLSVFGRQIRHKMSEGFPLLTTKKMYFKGIVTELLWFLRGDTNIKYLVDNDCHIWDGDAYKNYCKNIDTEVIKPGDTFLDTKRNITAVCKRKEIGTSKKIPILICEYEGCYIEEDCKKILSQEEFINKIKNDDDFAKKWGELGPVYGKQWRNWETMGALSFGTNHYEVKTEQIDQITNLIRDLKTNPDSRRLMVSAWNVAELDSMTLPPCHYGFQVYTRELTYVEKVREARKRFGFELEDGTRTFDINTTESIKFLQSTQRAISLMWNQRSVDTFLGLPFNIASYGLLLEIIAREVNMVPDELIGNLGDTHLYLNHIEQAKEQIGRELSLDERTELAKGIVVPLLGSKEDSYNEAGIPTRTREPYPLPKLVIVTNPELKFDEYVNDNFRLVNYQSHPTIKAKLSN